MMTEKPRYLAPSGKNPIHTAARWLTRRGVSLYGSRMLRVRGRKSSDAELREVAPGFPVFRLEFQRTA